MPDSNFSSYPDVSFRSKYKFGKTLGAGTYGIVREANGPDGKVAVKIILKKNVKGNEQMVYDELEMLQRMHHPNIVKCFEAFIENNTLNILMEYADAGDLSRKIKNAKGCYFS